MKTLFILEQQKFKEDFTLFIIKANLLYDSHDLRGKDIMAMYYTKNMTLGEIAEICALSKERIRQIISKYNHRINKNLIQIIQQGIEYPNIKNQLDELMGRVAAMLNILRPYLIPNSNVNEWILGVKLVDCDLTVRALNCLRAADIKTNGDLVDFINNYGKLGLLKLRIFGKKSLIEVESHINKYNLNQYIIHKP
jgi:DNA-directed RNA polymerase alpha subunit